MTESNAELDLRRRAHRRLIGAFILAALSIVTMMWLYWWLPSPKDLGVQGVIVNIIKPKSPDKAFDIDPLNALDNDMPLPNASITPSTQTALQQKTPKKHEPKSADNVYWLKSLGYLNAEILDKIRHSLTKKKIVFQEKAEINTDGKVITTLWFGPYSNEAEALKKQQQLSKRIKGLNLQSD